MRLSLVNAGLRQTVARLRATKARPRAAPCNGLGSMGKAFSSVADLPVTGLNETQRELYDMARQFSDNELAPNASKWDAEEIFPIETMKRAAELGFAGIFVREDVGGSVLKRFDGSVIFEALSGGCTSTAAYLTIHNMVGWMIDTYGSEEQRQRFLPDMCSLAKFSSYCLTEPNSGSDAASLSTRAVRDGSHYILNGSKAFISGGGVSDVYLVMARTGEKGPGGISSFLVEKGTPGLSFGANEKKMGWKSQPTAVVNLEDVRVPQENLLGKEGDGFKYAMKGLDGGRINIGTCSVGAAQACLERAVAYVGERKQFGRPIGDNQYLQFKLAEMATSLVSARLMIRHAASLLDAKDPGATMAAAMAKKTATDIGFQVCNDALQLHGGYGYLRDYHIERYVRDVRVHQILEGTNEVMRLIVARGLRDK